MADGERFFSAPQPGDIVWCHFPQDRILTPGPKPRPALVVKVGEIEGKPAVAVAYGTSQRLEERHPGEFAITRTNGEAFALAGLSFDTKFDPSNVIELPVVCCAAGRTAWAVPQAGVTTSDDHASRIRSLSGRDAKIMQSAASLFSRRQVNASQ